MIGEPAFSSWGWRVPFLVSLVLLVVSYYMRMRLEESPIYGRAGSNTTLARIDTRTNAVVKRCG